MYGTLYDKQGDHAYIKSFTWDNSDLIVTLDSSNNKITFNVKFANNKITYYSTNVTIVVSDGKLTRSQDLTLYTMAGSPINGTAYESIMKPYMGKQIKKILYQDPDGSLGNMYIASQNTGALANISWSAYNYNVDVATPQWSTEFFNGGIMKNVWFFDAEGRLNMGTSFDDPTPRKFVVTAMSDGFMLKDDYFKKVWEFHY